MLVAAVAAKVLFLFATIRCVKALSVVDNGTLQLAYVFGTTFMLLSEAGLRGYLIRELSRRRDDPDAARLLFSAVVQCRVVVAALVGGAAVALMPLAGYRGPVLGITVFFLGYGFLDSLNTLLKASIRTYERMEFEVVFTIAGRGAILAGIIAFERAGTLGLREIAISHVAGAALETVLLAASIRVFLPLRFWAAPNLERVGEAFRRSLPFAVVTLIGLLYLRTGTFVLSQLSDGTAVSFYNTAAKIPEALGFLPLAVVNALIPYLSRRHGDRGVMARYAAVLTRYLGFAGIFIACVFALETRWVILLLSKPEYLDAAAVFRLYGLYPLFSAVGYALANLLICMNAEKRVMQRYGMCFVLNVILNIALVPRMGAAGAAVALVVCEMTATVFDVTMLRARGVRVSAAHLGEFALAAAACVAALLLPVANPWIRVGLSGLALGAVAGGFALLHDREVLRRIAAVERGAAPPAD